MIDYEKLGLFYLGKKFDLEEGRRLDEPILYDSKDLTTHAAIIGMTGSGKTGLGVGLIEEALIDNIPVIAIDPKGDLPNLALTFPGLSPEEFEPWVDSPDAERQTRARKAAQLWKDGLAEWDQTPDRIAAFRQNTEIRIYTPGSSAAREVALLGPLAPPSDEIVADPDLLADTVEANAQAVLTLAGVDADPIASREHALLANILSHAWQRGRTMSLTELITAVRNPPFEKVGALDLETWFPARERFDLATRLNQLLASPSLQSWMRGEHLDVETLLHDPAGRPRGSVMSIAHLSEPERMFFVTLLLDRIISWMRRQSGTSSLRAILYIDEIFGYLPPVANPPSKKPLMTLLKQARAYGLGLVVATQNPVDLDYKALSNTGTWFLGRLQTERDRARVMDGLRTLSGGRAIDPRELDTLLASMKKRVFLLHNVHESEPVIFETRWVLSYLRGPMTREQLKALGQKTGGVEERSEPLFTGPPALPPNLDTLYEDDDQAARWKPNLFLSAELRYESRRHGVSEEREVQLLLPLSGEDRRADWDDAEETDLVVEDFLASAPAEAPHGHVPRFLSDEKKIVSLRRSGLRSVRQNYPLLLFHHPETKLVSAPDESEGAFRSRVAQRIREDRDGEIEKLRGRYDKKLRTLEARLERAMQTVEKQAEQARAKKFDTAVSFGTSILGAFLGRKRVSGFGTAVRRASRIRDEEADVDRAEERVETVREEIAALEAEFERETSEFSAPADPGSLEVEELPIPAKASNVELDSFALVWTSGGA